ncbi:transposase [bacterium]|nr:transposase [bacterium]MBU1614619.1 transposase [bacterium]
MPNYRRAREGRIYFFTVVTFSRQPFLCLEESRVALRRVIKEVCLSRPFKINALVLLPDHLHCIWTLPEGDTDYSRRWGLIKSGFTKMVGKELVGNAHPTMSRRKHREGLVWQRRFWEHQIRDERDYEVHCNYIHYNPVKHGLVNAPKDWAYSTFHRYVKKDIYPEDWGSMEPIELPQDIGGE